MADFSQLKVLLVDDEKHIRTLVKAILRQLDFGPVIEASNGREAVDCYEKNDIDVVMMDINMPLMDGKTALRELLRLDEDAFVIMLTSISDMDTIQECVELGASNYLRKDTPVDQLSALIRETCDEVL